MEFSEFASLKGKKTILIPAELKHKRMVYDFGTEPYIAQWIFCEPAKATVSYEEYDKDYVDYYFTGKELHKGRGYMICEKNKNIVGFISYSSYNLNEHIYELDLWLSCESVCGKGYGSDSLAVLSNYLLSVDEVNKLIIVPNNDNFRAIASYKKAGYKEIEDNLMELLLQEYPNGKPLFRQK